ncbi:hypothetical protein AAY473_023465 [Plecturocebus cupreus]
MSARLVLNSLPCDPPATASQSAGNTEHMFLQGDKDFQIAIALKRRKFTEEQPREPNRSSSSLRRRMKTASEFCIFN